MNFAHKSPIVIIIIDNNSNDGHRYLAALHARPGLDFAQGPGLIYIDDATVDDDGAKSL